MTVFSRQVPEGPLADELLRGPHLGLQIRALLLGIASRLLLNVLVVVKAGILVQAVHGAKERDALIDQVRYEIRGLVDWEGLLLRDRFQ